MSIEDNEATVVGLIIERGSTLTHLWYIMLTDGNAGGMRKRGVDAKSSWAGWSDLLAGLVCF